MRIDFIFDTVCPWCYIGKSRFERALALRAGVRAEIRFRPFLLNPDMPPLGLDRATYLERKFGSSYRIQRIHGAASQAGEAEGIPFNFEAIERMPNSVDSHRLIHWASDSGRQPQLVQALFEGFFLRGQDIGHIPVLRSLAEKAGLPGQEAEDYLRSPAGITYVETENARVHRLGVSGVPCYIFDERYAVAGAQEPDMLARLLDIASETEVETASR